MGQRAKSDHQHFVEGTPPAAKPSTESHVVGGRPKFPRDLDPSLKRIFKNLCKLLAERRALTKGDVELIRLYCFQYDRHRPNVAELRTEGEITTYFRLDSNGKSVPQVTTNLRLKICTEAEKQMVSVLVALGLTPTAKDRARPTAPEKPAVAPPPDPMVEFLNRAPRGPLLIPVNPNDMKAEDNDDEQPQEETSEPDDSGE